jgi:hypothetical protein
MKNWIIAAIVMLSLGSCKNLVPYSDALKTKYSLTDEQMKHLQFYVSDPITLQRKIASGATTEVTSGKVRVINGEKVEEIIIPSGTPGVLVRNDAGKLEISFEKNDDHFLRFGANPDRYQSFVLLASEWKGKIGNVTYAGQKYYTSPESTEAVLLIDLRKIENNQKEERVAKGRKAN